MPMPSSVMMMCQIIIALGIYNVWILRVNKPTAWRGGAAKNMVEEFRAYGLSESIMKLVGACKVLIATCLIIGIWYPPVTPVAALALAAFMLAAVIMHARVRDPIRKSVPAAIMLLLCLLVACQSSGY